MSWQFRSFSNELTKQLVPQSETGNVLFSPLGILTSLLILRLGSNGTAREKIESNLKISKSLTPLPSALKERPRITHRPPSSETDLEKLVRERMEIDQLIKEWSEKGQAIDRIKSFYDGLVTEYESSLTENYTMVIGNKLLVSNEYEPILPHFKETLKAKYNGSIGSTDFSYLGKVIKNQLNDWVDSITGGLIKCVFDKPPDLETKLMLLNLVYFKSFWQQSFSKVHGTEFLVDGTRREAVPFLNQQLYSPHISADITLKTNDTLTVEAFTIPYVNRNVSMIIFLAPEHVSVNTILSDHSQALYELVDTLKSIRESVKIDLHIPTFRLMSNIDLESVLVSMGSGDLFKSSHLSGISNSSSVKLTQMNHISAIDIDERGTNTVEFSEAQQTDEKSAVKIVLNRPFAFTIWDWSKGIPLFIGKVSNPSEWLSSK